MFDIWRQKQNHAGYRESAWGTLSRDYVVCKQRNNAVQRVRECAQSCPQVHPVKFLMLVPPYPRLGLGLP